MLFSSDFFFNPLVIEEVLIYTYLHISKIFKNLDKVLSVLWEVLLLTELQSGLISSLSASW